MIDHDTLNGIDYEADYDIKIGGDVRLGEVRPDKFTSSERDIICNRIKQKHGDLPFEEHQKRVKNQLWG